MANSAELDRRELLSRIFVFGGLSPGDLDLLAECTVRRKLGPRDELFHKGDKSDEAYAILAGALKASATSPEGREITFSIMGPGEVFGEVAMLSGGRRTATVQALDASELLVIRRRDLLLIFERQPRIAIACMAALAERLAHVSQMAEDNLFRSLQSRLARKVTALAERYGDEQDEAGTLIELRLSQTELGNLVGATREAVNKQLRAWERLGWVNLEGGRLRVSDLAALEGLAGMTDL